MPFVCRHCGGSFCAEHRLPENHHCSGLYQKNNVFENGFQKETAKTSEPKHHLNRPSSHQYYTKESSPSHKHRPSKKIQHRKTFNKAIKFTVIWLIILGIITGIFYHFHGFTILSSVPAVHDLTIIMAIISFVIGFYDTFHFVKYIERKLTHSDFSLWLRRIISIVMLFVGLLLTFIGLMFISIILIYLDQPMPLSTIDVFFLNPILVIIFGFSVGLILFSAYMEFTFERKSGIIIYSGKQKF